MLNHDLFQPLCNGQSSDIAALTFKIFDMSKTTSDLIEGLNQMLKNRGSMTVEDVQLLQDVIDHLKLEEQLKGVDRLQNKWLVVAMLLRLLLDPKIGAELAHLISSLLEKLH